MIRVLVPVVLQLIFVTIIYAQPATEKERIDALNQRAETFRGSRPDSMIALANRALEASKSTGYMKGEADALRWLALGKMLTGEAGVNELLNRSIDLFTTLDDQRGLASTLNIQATHLLQQGAFDLAGSLNNVANLLNELGRHSEAVAFHERAMALNMAINNPRSIGNSLMNLGSTYLRMGNPELAIDFYERAKEIRTSMNDVRSLSLVHSGLADAYLSLREFDLAARNAERAYELAISARVPLEASIASRFAYLAFKEAKNPVDAVRYLEIHKTLSDSLFTIDRQKAISNLESVAELNRKNDEIRALESGKSYERNLITAILISLAITLLLLFGIHRARLRERMISTELRRVGAMKDRMFSILSHDLRSPLNSLNSMIELMDMDALNADEWRSFKATLMRQFDVTDETLRDVLLWANDQFAGELPTIQAVNLKEAVDSNVELINLIASRKGVDILVNVDSSASVLADRAHLMAIIRNLLTNAVKFTPTGKSIRLRSQTIDGNQLLFSEDEGVGMSPDKVNA